MMRSRMIGLMVAVSILFGSGSLMALPFNDDMVNVQKRTGVMMRPKDPRSVAVGASKYYVKDRTSAENLSNPQPQDKFSVESGSRLYRVNCYPCHGNIEAKPWATGPVGEKLNGLVPNIQGNVEGRRDYTTVTDGWIYSVIHYGSMSGVMPAYGWKLSPSEHWDIVNYVRYAQKRVG